MYVRVEKEGGIEVTGHGGQTKPVKIKQEVVYLLSKILDYSLYGLIRSHKISPSSVRDLVNTCYEYGFICKEEKEKLVSHFEEVVKRKMDIS